MNDKAKVKSLPPLVATRLRDKFALRPAGCLGSCGWVNGIPWQVQYVKRLPPGVDVVP